MCGPRKNRGGDSPRRSSLAFSPLETVSQVESTKKLQEKALDTLATEEVRLRAVRELSIRAKRKTDEGKDEAGKALYAIAETNPSGYLALGDLTVYHSLSELRRACSLVVNLMVVKIAVETVRELEMEKSRFEQTS